MVYYNISTGCKLNEILLQEHILLMEMSLLTYIKKYLNFFFIMILIEEVTPKRYNLCNLR